MTNAVETLFGLAVGFVLCGLILRFMKRPAPSRRFLSLGFAALILGVIGEVFLRVMP